MLVAAAAARVAACHPELRVGGRVLLVGAPHLVHLLLRRGLERVGLVYGTLRYELDAVDADNVGGERIGGGRLAWYRHVGGDSYGRVERYQPFCAACDVTKGVVYPVGDFCVRVQGRGRRVSGRRVEEGGGGRLVQPGPYAADSVSERYRHCPILSLLR